MTDIDTCIAYIFGLFFFFSRFSALDTLCEATFRLFVLGLLESLKLKLN